jgi:hypothetical protein
MTFVLWFPQFCCGGVFGRLPTPTTMTVTLVYREEWYASRSKKNIQGRNFHKRKYIPINAVCLQIPGKKYTFINVISLESIKEITTYKRNVYKCYHVLLLQFDGWEIDAKANKRQWRLSPDHSKNHLKIIMIMVLYRVAYSHFHIWLTYCHKRVTNCMVGNLPVCHEWLHMISANCWR